MSGAAVFEAVSAFFHHNNDMLTILAAATGGGLALHRYGSEKSWRNKQDAYDYAQTVLDDRKAMAALRMIDWSSGTFPDDIVQEFQLAKGEGWDVDEVARALRPHDTENPGAGAFTDKEYAIRELFDVGLARFERLGHFLQSGIISVDDFPNTLAYYIRVLTEERLGALAPALRRYLLRYGFDNTRYLVKVLNGPPPPTGWRRWLTPLSRRGEGPA